MRLALSALAALVCSATVNAACVNKFTNRAEGARHIVTLLTGKLTFQDAQALAAAIRNRKADPLEWIDSKGRTIAKQIGDLKVIRPMPVGCDGNASGVIMVASFLSAQRPQKAMTIKIADEVVTFDEQE